MPPVKSSTSKRRTYIAFTIFSLSKVILTYSYYTEKGLVYIAITLLSSRQPFFYAKYIKANIRFSYNVRSVSNTKYTRLIRL